MEQQRWSSSGGAAAVEQQWDSINGKQQQAVRLGGVQYDESVSAPSAAGQGGGKEGARRGQGGGKEGARRAGMQHVAGDW